MLNCEQCWEAIPSRRPKFRCPHCKKQLCATCCGTHPCYGQRQTIAEELTAIAVEGLDKLSPEEREKRIQALENSVAAQAKGEVSQ